MEEELELTVRIMPAGEEHILELSGFTTGKEIINALMDKSSGF